MLKSASTYRLSWLTTIKASILTLCLLQSGLSAADLVVGQVIAFSGPLAPTGEGMKLGADAYFNAINAKGGVHGQKIRLESRDDGYKVPETVKQTKALITESNPIALIGFLGTGNVEALVKEKVLDEAGIALIGMRTGATSLRQPVNPYLFHTRASYSAEIRKILGYINSIGLQKIAIFYQDDAFGKDGLAAAEEAVKDTNIKIVAKGGYEKNTTKVENAVKVISAANPQAVVLVSNTAASGAFIKALKESGQQAQLISINATDGPQVAKNITPALAKGLGISQVVPNPYKKHLPLLKEFHANLAKYNKDAKPNHTVLEGYVAAKVLVEALQKAGPNPTRKKVRDALEGLRNFDLGGMEISFSPKSHEGTQFVDLTVLNREGVVLD